MPTDFLGSSLRRLMCWLRWGERQAAVEDTPLFTTSLLKTFKESEENVKFKAFDFQRVSVKGPLKLKT